MIKYYSWSVLDQIAVSSGNFLTIFLGAMLLGLEDQGILVFLLTFYFFVLVMSISLVYAPIQNIYPRLQCGLIYIYSAFLYHLLLSVVIILCVFLLITSISSFSSFEITNEVLILFLIYIFFQQIADFIRRVSYVFLNPKYSFLFSFLLYIPRIAVLMFLMPHNLEDYVNFLLVATLVSTLVILLLFFKEIFRFGSLKFDLSCLYEHVKFSKNIAYSAPMGWLVGYLPTVLLGIFSGPVLMGILGTFRSFIGVANVLVEMIEVSLIPKLVQYYQSGKSELVNRIFIYVVAIFVCFSAIAMSIVYISFDFVVSMINENYVKYMDIFLILIGAYVFYFLSRMYVLYFRVSSVTSVEVKFSLLSIITMFSLIPLIYYFDIVGAACVFLLTPLIAILILHFSLDYSATKVNEKYWDS
jgi:O-antigen/teichoic acid export membrane protein